MTSAPPTVDWTTLPPPQPLPDVDTEPFWAALDDGELRVCRCPRCRFWHVPPLERCRKCAEPTTWESVSGRGTIYTFIIQRQPAVVGYFAEVPYAVAIVELDEQPGLRLPGRVVGIDPDDVRIGMAVRARIEPLAGGEFHVAVWEPAG